MDEIMRAVHRQGRRQLRWHRDSFGFFPQICVSHVRRGFRRGRSSCCCRVCPTRSDGLRGSQSKACTHRAIRAEARGDPTGADFR